MKTNLQFIDKNSGKRSDCADHFNIEVSSRQLSWEGILLEKGYSDTFKSKNIMTKNFFFATELKYEFNWTVKVEDKDIEVHSHIGDTWINAPLTAFSHHNNNPSEFLVLTIAPDIMFSSYQGYLPIDNLKFISDYNIHDEYIGHMMQMMLLEVNQNGANGRSFIQQLIKLFSTYYINNYSNINSLIESGNLYPVISNSNLLLIDEYIQNHVSENISIDDLATVLKMNKFHFLKEFKKVTNITPYQYILTKRVEMTKELLKNSDQTLVEIALNLGFSDSSHLTRTFKKYTHLTPRQFKLSIM